MNKQSILNLSKNIKKEADKILEKTDLIFVLKKYGKVIFTGSYKYDLMWEKDIDVHVISDKMNRKNAVKLHNELINLNKFTTCQFSDYEHWHHSEFPDGYYVGVKWKSRDCSQKWAIDIWYCKRFHEINKKVDKLIKDKLNLEKKNIILGLKQYSKDNNLGAISPIIYKAVLENGIRTINEFKKHLNKND